ncbi:hypothetical protein Goari_015111, partial [Gossypium aridum]|nr:hypothetical protein [Gossypium aridum]
NASCLGQDSTRDSTEQDIDIFGAFNDRINPLSVSSLSWKDMLVGKETFDQINKSDGQYFADNFSLTEQGVKKSFVDGVPSIDFSERVYQLLEKKTSTSVVLKMLGRNLGITTLQNRLYGIWRQSKPF